MEERKKNQNNKLHSQLFTKHNFMKKPMIRELLNSTQVLFFILSKTKKNRKKEKTQNGKGEREKKRSYNQLKTKSAEQITV